MSPTLTKDALLSLISWPHPKGVATRSFGSPHNRHNRYDFNSLKLGIGACRNTYLRCFNVLPEFIAMDIDRNRYFMFGIILFLLGLQFRIVDSFVLNESTTRAMHRFAQQSKITDRNLATDVYMQVSTPKKSMRPPNWLGLVLLTVGGVMSLHALVLPRRQ
jgi:hypothetical protein